MDYDVSETPSDHSCFMLPVLSRYKLFNLARGYNKNLTPGDVGGMASCVLLAALAIPPYGRAAAAVTDAQAEVERDRSSRMASILGFPPVRRTPLAPPPSTGATASCTQKFTPCGGAAACEAHAASC